MRVLLCIVAIVAVSGTVFPQPEGFRLHARFKGTGACLNAIVGPGPEPGTQRLFASHIYGGDTLDIVAVDPLTGKSEAFSSPISSECSAWALALGPDGQVYAGTLPTAHILRLDWKERRLVDMGRPSQTEQYIWQLALASDGKLYGCTYPSAKLVRYDTATRKGEDLGRMDPRELYARSVAANDRGFVYIGTGPGKCHIVAYEIATVQHRNILPHESQTTGFGDVYRGEDGCVYGSAGSQHFRFEGWTATPVAPEQCKPRPPLTLADGRRITYRCGTVTVHDTKNGQEITHKTRYVGKSQNIFRIGLGPDGRLYGSTAMPIHFFWADPDSDEWEEIGQLGGGEFYSFIAYKDTLVGAAYGGQAPLMVYHPGRPYAPNTKPTGNPWMVHYESENSGWRPMAMDHGPGNKLYIGAVSGYGLLGGPLCVFDPERGEVDQFLHLVKDHSVVALAALPDGSIAGGTTVRGGGGSFPTQKEARIFLWDPVKREVIFETTPVPGAGDIDALAVGKDGFVYGFAGATLFVVDPASRKVVNTSLHNLGSVVFNSLGSAGDGELYGLATGGIFTIDTVKRQSRVLAAYPAGIHGGFAIGGKRIYFTCGPQIVSYSLP